MSSAIQQLRTLFADEEKPAEINAVGEFDNKTFNRFLSQQNIASRFKEGRQDLETIDAAMNNFKNVEEDEGWACHEVAPTCQEGGRESSPDKEEEEECTSIFFILFTWSLRRVSSSFSLGSTNLFKPSDFSVP